MASATHEAAAAMYVNECMSIPDVAKALKVGYSTARKMLLDAGVALRTRADGVRAARHKLGVHAIGTKRFFSDEWKSNISRAKKALADKTAAGVSHKTNGYSAITRGPNKGRGLHVVMMETRIGRPLRDDEVVHHIDGNKQNNSFSNLELMTRSEHSRLHLEERRNKNGKR